MSKKIFILRHGIYPGGNDNYLTDEGLFQTVRLGALLLKEVNDSKITIWSSTARRSIDTSIIIKSILDLKNRISSSFDPINIERFNRSELISSRQENPKLDWLKQEIDKFNGKILIIITHEEYVIEFPKFLGFDLEIEPDQSSGIKIEKGTCIPFNWYQ